MKEKLIWVDDNAKIVYGNRIIEYQEIRDNINDIIQTLKKLKLNQLRIGICLNRNERLIYTLLAILEAGYTFVPIDYNWPKSRINKVLNESNTDVVYINKEYKFDFVDHNKKILVDEEVEKNCNDIFTSLTDIPDNLIAYIMFTSGSTGDPKGIEITRKSLLNFINNIPEAICFSAGNKIVSLTNISFDIFLLESVLALYKGLTVILSNDDEQRNPRLMAKLIQDNDVDMVQMTPSRMQLLINHDRELSCLKSVKVIMIGGEPFPLSLLHILQEKTTAKIYNMYGPTETTIWSTVSNLTNKNRIDIGQPIKNTEIYIVDDNLNILPYRQVGEICISGEGLAKGYVGRDDLTAEKFIYLPQKPDTKVYRTGDIGKYLQDGNIEYLGRTDNQIKIRGHRVELEEIESHLNQFKGIKQSVVISLGTNETDNIIGVYYTSEDNINAKDILNFLSTKLPSYMFPTIFKRVEEFILTANGKIDRKRVLECREIKSDESVLKTSIIDEIPNVQKKAFDIVISNLCEKISDNVSLDMDFNSVGLDSITFIKIIVALESEFDFEFDDEMLLITKFPTIKAMVEYVESKIATSFETM